MQLFPVYIIEKQTAVSQKIVVAQCRFIHRKKGSVHFHLQMTVAPAIFCKKHFMPPYAFLQIRQTQLIFINNIIYFLLFMNSDQKFFHIPLVSIMSGKALIETFIFSVTILKNRFKIRLIKNLYSLRPVTFRQICKMEQIFHGAKTGCQRFSGYHHYKRKFIFPLITDYIKTSLQYIAGLHTFPMENITDFFACSKKLLCQTFHPAVRRIDISICYISRFSNQMKTALIVCPCLQIDLDPALGKRKLPALIFKFSFQNSVNSILHISQPLSLSIYQRSSFRNSKEGANICSCCINS